MPWLLLIYTVPRSPSRKRAFVWRELKKIGAVYLRDGVCALPDRDDTRRAIHEIAATIRDYEGRAIVIEEAQLDAETVEGMMAEALTARRAEYDEIARELTSFLEHVERERNHREMTHPELDELEGDLDKLRRWIAQVGSRDYFGPGTPEQITDLLAACIDALETFPDRVIQETGTER